MKILVDFLGFGSSYRQEITIDDNTFNVAEVSLEDFKPKFSDITFQCKKSEIFKFYQRTENNIYTLQKSVTSSSTTFYIDDDSIANDTLLWIGNERIRIVQKNLDGTYSVERGYNNSIAVSHFYDEQIFNKTGVVLLSEKKITIQNTIIRFVKTNNIKQNEEILGYFSIDEVISRNNKTVEITAKPIFDLFSDKTLIKFSTNQTLTNSFSFKYFFNLIQTSNEIYSNEFLRLFMLSENIDNAFECFVEFESDSSEYATISFKKIFETYLNFNNAILYFDSQLNRYTTTRLDKLVSTEQISDIYLLDYININSKIECEMIQKVSQITLKTKLNAVNEAGIVSGNNYVEKENTFIDYDLATVTSEKLELDMTSINVIFESDAVLIANNKIKLYNNMNEKITLTCPMWYDFFKVGQTYNIKDCHKIDTFTNQSTNNYFKCYSKENDTVKFIYIATAVRYLVAPAIPMFVENGNNTFLYPKFDGNTKLSDYINSDTTDLSQIKILKSDKAIFEIGDVVKLSNYVTQSDIEVTIIDIGDDYIEIDTSLTASNYIVTFPDLTALSNKYSSFLYTDINEI